MNALLLDFAFESATGLFFISVSPFQFVISERNMIAFPTNPIIPAKGKRQRKRSS